MKKDWKTTIRNKQIFLPMIILPVLFSVIMPFLLLTGVLYSPEAYIGAFGDKEELMQLMNIPKNYNTYLVAAVISAKMFMLPYFLFIPTMTSVIISADSFAGEKDRKTMESLALLPLSKTELIIGKVMAAFVPAIILSFIFFGIQGIIINFIFLEHLEGNILIFTDITWLFTIFILTPALAFLNVLISTIISSRSKDFKSAQSITGILVTPVLVFLFAQIFNPAFLSPVMILIISGILGIFSLLFIYLGNKLLDVEKLILML